MQTFVPKLLLAAWIVLAASAASGAYGAEAGYATRALELRAEPRSDAPVTGKLAANARFELLKREQAWAQISAGSQTGWVLFFFLMNGEPPAQQSASGGVGDALGLATRRQGPIVATIGIRGLDEERLKSAQFNAAEVQKLETFLVPRPAAVSFAQEAPLASRRVEYLPEGTASQTMGGR